MVKSRYLRSAPRPETWDERAEGLLKSLGGSASKREMLLRETLASLKNMHADKQKTGPGRKSNAEHAIAFYEYVLETITEEKEEKQQKEGALGDPPAAIEKPQEEKPKKRGRGRPPKKKREEDEEKRQQSETGGEKDKKKEEKSEDDNSESVESMDTAEFISQHNDLCEVCNMPGELLMCNTCNLVFHLDCVRPKLEGIPPDSWVCAYCVMSGVEGHKQNAKARKNAAAAVRLMARMRKEIARQKRNTKVVTRDGDTENAASKIKSETDSPKPGEDWEPPKKRSVGRPKKVKPKPPESLETKDNAKIEMSESEAVKPDQPEITPKKRPVGRPKKTKSAPRSQETEEKQERADQQDATPKAPNRDGHPGEEDAGKMSDEDKAPSTSSESDSKSDGEHGGVDSGKTNKKKFALRQISDALSESMKVNDDEVDRKGEASGRRIRRDRKRATYYDPQNGPASAWQSDGKNEWKYLTSHDTGSDDEVDDGSYDEGENEKETGLSDSHEEKESNENKSTRRSKKAEKGDEPWCKFCMDDKSIPVCCFCACRVCFGKHEQSKLLLCDRCDDEYHTFCLNPPLKTVPSSKSWFCPSCKAEEKSSKILPSPNVATRGAKSSPKAGIRVSGRKSTPPKHKKEAIEAASKGSVTPPVKRGPGRPRIHPLPDQQRKRGRPPKTDKETPQRNAPPKSISPPTPSSSDSMPRKRGRPRKHPLPEEEGARKKKRVQSPSSGVKRGRGRPPKSKNKSNSLSSRKRSRSPGLKKTEKKMPYSDDTKRFIGSSVEDDSSAVPGNLEAPPPPPPPITVSRSGRAVKRISFHDEIEEGEQHLKSARYAETQRRSAEQSEQSEEPYVQAHHENEEHTMEMPLFEHDEHHGVDPHFLANMPDVCDMANLVPLDSSFIDQSSNIMPLGIPEPTNVFVEARVPEHAPEPEEEKKPAATITRDIAPMVHVNVNTDWHRPDQAETNPGQAIASHLIHTSQGAISTPASTAAPTPLGSAPAAPSFTLENSLQTPSVSLSSPPVASTTTATPPVASRASAPVASTQSSKQPRRKPGARECMQISRRFGVNVIPEKYMDILTDYCKRGKVEHLIRMRERLDEHSRFLESQLAGLESLVQERGELDVVVPAMPETENEGHNE